jgi:predicted methyltransferase
MTSLFTSPVAVSHWWLKEFITPGMMAVDATAGNGYDTAFLADRVGPSGRVFAFDIQQEALKETEKRLVKLGLRDRVQLIAAGHERLLEYVQSPINAMVFNLGYRPRGDKTIITRPETTIEALKAGMTLLAPSGLIVMTVYVGHPGGAEEWTSLKQVIADLPSEEWQVVKLRFVNRPEHAPFNIGLQKIG